MVSGGRQGTAAWLNSKSATEESWWKVESVVVPEAPRSVPPEFAEAHELWKKKEMKWTTAHYAIGVATAIFSALTAGTVLGEIKPPWISAILSGIAVVLAGTQTTLASQQRASGFLKAHRHLQKAMIRYRTDPSMTTLELGTAEQEAIDLMYE